jgi:hypothetical protein
MPSALSWAKCSFGSADHNALAGSGPTHPAGEAAVHGRTTSGHTDAAASGVTGTPALKPNAAASPEQDA